MIRTTALPTARPTVRCPHCAAPVSGTRPSYGVVALYPRGCWLTPRQAQPIADRLTQPTAA